jgi:hypothetical protein
MYRTVSPKKLPHVFFVLFVRASLLLSLACSFLGGCTRCERYASYDISYDPSTTQPITVDYNNGEDETLTLTLANPRAQVHRFEIANRNATNVTGGLSGINYQDVVKIRRIAVGDSILYQAPDNVSSDSSTVANAVFWRSEGSAYERSSGDRSLRLHLGYATHQMLFTNTLSEPVLMRYSTAQMPRDSVLPDSVARDSLVIVQPNTTVLLYSLQTRTGAMPKLLVGDVEPLTNIADYVRSVRLTTASGRLLLNGVPAESRWKRQEEQWRSSSLTRTRRYVLTWQ